MELNSLRYDSYTTGIYGKHKTGGVTLQFICEATGANYYVIFNADLKRKRNTKQHKIGTLLPSGRFSVGRRSQFYQFWFSTGLDMPQRLSGFSDSMGKLKAFTFCAKVTKGRRLDSGTLVPLMSKPPKLLIVSNKAPTKFQQLSNKTPTRIANNDSPLPLVINESQENQTTCLNNYGISKQGTTDTRIPVTPVTTTETVREQTNDQWLKDCDSYF